MKNADLPAMPIVDADGTPMSHGELSDWSDNSCLGLTKREEFALKIMAGMYSNSAITDCLSEQAMGLIATASVKAADTLFFELERTK
ncbi:MAG: hypothetical protein RR390_00375 [Hafnia sp.]